MKTIHLSTIKNVEYYLTGINKETKDIIFEKHKEKTLKESIIQEIIGSNILKIGSKKDANPHNLSPYVAYLKGYNPVLKRPERRVQYRCYNMSEERQLKNAHILSICEDAKSSANSAISAINEEYLVLWFKNL